MNTESRKNEEPGKDVLKKKKQDKIPETGSNEIELCNTPDT